MEIRAAKPGVRIVKLSDCGGLQLWIMPDGAKRRRFAYRLVGLQKVRRPEIHEGEFGVDLFPRLPSIRARLLA